MTIFKIGSDVNKELCYFCAGERVTVVRVHVAAYCLWKCAPNFDVLDIVLVELLCFIEIQRLEFAWIGCNGVIHS